MTAGMVSVVIPTLNSGRVLDRCLDALERASGVDEVLVLDAGSDDGSHDRARRRRGVRVIDLPGTSIQRRLNLGIVEARSDLCLLLNSDAFVDPDTPRLLAEHLLANDDAGACAASLRFDDGRPQKSGGVYKTLTGLTLDALRFPTKARGVPARGRPAPTTGWTQVTWVPYCCAVLRREAWESVGGFDDRYGFYFEDDDFARALSKAGWSHLVCWDATAIHLGGGTTRLADSCRWYVRYQESALIYLRKWYPRGWRIFATAWTLRATLNAILWRLREGARRMRSDDEGAAQARAWVRAFSTTRRP